MIHDICYNEVIVLSDCFDKLCRHSTDDGIRRDIFGYYCSRCDNGIVPDAYSLKNGGIGAYPHVLAESVVECGENYIMPDLTTVTDCNPTMILKVAAGIDKHIFANSNVLTEIRVKRRKYTK